MFGYIVAHYCLVFTTGAVRIVVVGYISPIIVRCMLGEWFLLLCLVILSPITVYGLTEEWFLLLWLVILSSIIYDDRRRSEYAYH